MEQLTTLYRFYDASDNLLYVGITNFLPQRIKQHSRRAKWHEFAVRAVIEHYATRALALEAEQKAIQSENPFYNLAGSLQYEVDTDEHFFALCAGELLDPIHQKTYREINFYLMDAPSKSIWIHKLLWAFLNAMYELWDEDNLPCVACRTIVHAEYAHVAHGKVCDDYESELREAAK